MTYRTTIIFFIIALFLGGLYFFYIRPGMEEKKLIEEFEKTFFRADTSEIEFIRLDAGQGPITINKSGDSWKITSPSEYAPDLGAIESLFNALAKGRIIKVVGSAGDLDAFGFETTHIILTLGYRGTIDVLRIAGESPSAIGHYAFSERLGKIFIVDKDFVKAMNLKPLDLREKRLFIFAPEELTRIVIHRKQDRLDIQKRGDNWQMLLPLYMRADDTYMRTLIDLLHTRKAEAFLTWTQEFEKLEQKMSLELYDTRGVTLGTYDLYFRGTEWDKGVMARRPGAQEAMRVSRDFWELLDADYSRFAYRNMISLDEKKALRIVIRSGDDRFALENRGDGWRFGSTPVPVETTSELIASLREWKAEKLIGEDRELGREQFALEVIYADRTDRVSVSDFNMDYEISDTAMFAARRGMVKKEKVDYLYARSSNLERSAIVSSVDVYSILDIVRVFADE